MHNQIKIYLFNLVELTAGIIIINYSHPVQISYTSEPTKQLRFILPYIKII